MMLCRPCLRNDDWSRSYHRQFRLPFQAGGRLSTIGWKRVTVNVLLSRASYPHNTESAAQQLDNVQARSDMVTPIPASVVFEIRVE